MFLLYLKVIYFETKQDILKYSRNMNGNQVNGSSSDFDKEIVRENEDYLEECDLCHERFHIDLKEIQKTELLHYLNNYLPKEYSCCSKCWEHWTEN